MEQKAVNTVNKVDSLASIALFAILTKLLKCHSNKGLVAVLNCLPYSGIFSINPAPTAVASSSRSLKVRYLHSCCVA